MPKKIRHLEHTTEIDDYLTLYEMFQDEEYMDKAEKLDDELNEQIHEELISFIGNKEYMLLTNMFDLNENEAIINTIFHITNPEVAAFEIMNIISRCGLLNSVDVGKNGINFVFEDDQNLMLFDFTKGVIRC